MLDPLPLSWSFSHNWLVPLYMGDTHKKYIIRHTRPNSSTFRLVTIFLIGQRHVFLSVMLHVSRKSLASSKPSRHPLTLLLLVTLLICLSQVSPSLPLFHLQAKSFFPSSALVWHKASRLSSHSPTLPPLPDLWMLLLGLPPTLFFPRLVFHVPRLSRLFPISPSISICHESFIVFKVASFFCPTPPSLSQPTA